MARPGPIINIWVARIIPVILIAIVIYSAFVITKPIATDSLINPDPQLPVRPRQGAAIALLIIYYLLVIITLVCYARLLHQVTRNPGYIPRTEAWYQRRAEKKARRQKETKARSPSRVDVRSDPVSDSSKESNATSASTESPNLVAATNGDEDSDVPFWQRDIFMSTADGRLALCSSCLSHKTDRTHHCSEVNRCVSKMDHFCPWVGGVISETSFKFFIQFLVYAALLCITVLIPTAYLFAERQKLQQRPFLDVHYLVVLFLSGLFLLFTVGMAGNSIYLALVNSSTVENLNKGAKVWFFAILIPHNSDGSLQITLPEMRGAHSLPFKIITYPRPNEEERFLVDHAKKQAQLARDGRSGPGRMQTTSTTTTLPAHIQSPPIPPPSASPDHPLRTFAVIPSTPGENPFDIGTWNNIREVMGYSVWEWLLPIQSSPCADHSSRHSLYPLNEELVERLKQKAGLSGSSDGGARPRRSKGKTRVRNAEDG